MTSEVNFGPSAGEVNQLDTDLPDRKQLSIHHEELNQIFC